MSPPTSNKMAARSPNGHAVRPVIDTKRRNDIWNHVYRVGMENPLCKDWCTRDELVKLSLAKPGLDSLTTPELTEVLRGKKQKAAHGVESHRVEGGDILWRFIEPGTKSRGSQVGKPPTTPSKKPMATTSGSSAKKKSAARAPATPSSSKKSTSTPSKSKSQASAPPTGEPKDSTGPPARAKQRTAPLRPKPKSPRVASKSPARRKVASPAPASTRASRKRSATPDTDDMLTPLRPAITKKPRLSSDRGTRSVSFTVDQIEGGGENSSGDGAVARNGGEGGGGWCTIS